MTTADQLQAVSLWMQEQVKLHPYGEISVRLQVHDGQIVLVERGTTVRFKCEKAKP